MEFVKCKYFFPYWISCKGWHSAYLRESISITDLRGFAPTGTRWFSAAFASWAARVWVLPILWGTLPFLLGLRKGGDQLQLCAVIGATQSVAGTGEEGDEDKSMLQGQLQYKIYYWQQDSVVSISNPWTKLFLIYFFKNLTLLFQ